MLLLRYALLLSDKHNSSHSPCTCLSLGSPVEMCNSRVWFAVIAACCRLWQLQSKMAAVGGEATYEARLERVAAARVGVEQRLLVSCAALRVRVPLEVLNRLALHGQRLFPHPCSFSSSLLAAALQKRIELVDSYSRVKAMIEIEVEMDSDLPAAEVLGEAASQTACQPH